MKTISRLVLIALVIYGIIGYGQVVTFWQDPITRFYDHRIFSDLTELQKLEEYCISEIEEDNIIESADFNGYCHKICWNENEYDVYAYVFAETDDTKEYVKALTGDYPTLANEYFFKMGLRRKYYIAYAGNLLFRVETAREGDLAGFLDWINDDFSYEYSIFLE